jgi:endonuclease YncB( thermonuclease family)
MKGPSKVRASEAREYLAAHVLGKQVELLNPRTEKYGRILADVRCGDINVSELMLGAGYAVRYDGGPKN